MEPRIILSEADFSQNNIGSLIVLSDFTKKVLSKQTQYSQNSSEARALNTFLNYLQTQGFIGGNSPKFKFLCIPALAASHDELLYNLASLDANGYPTDAMVQDEKTRTNKAIIAKTDSQGRIVGVGTYSPSAEYISSSDFNNISRFPIDDEEVVANQYAPSRSLFMYQINNMNVDEGNTLTSNILVYTASSYRNFGFGNICFGVDMGDKTTRFGFKPNPGKLLGFSGISYNNVTPSVEYNGEPTVTELEVQASKYKIPSGATTPQLWIAKYAYADYQKAGFGIFGLSDYLTATEMAGLRTAVETLMTALHVTAYKESIANS